MIAPFTFRPLLMERPWGGRALERLYARPLPPPPVRIGESWDVVDRDDFQSVVADGEWAGVTLHSLWQEKRSQVFGQEAEGCLSTRFPLLLKILDARETLSIQVHPPAGQAARLGGEPKTELWYVAEAEPGALLHVGVRPGVDRDGFRAALEKGTAAELVPSLPVRAGDSIFIPSGRLHAIGAGLVIFEIQQNSDTTYRVFDWNRVGADGRPRTLHIEESLACIDFQDTAPTLNPAGAMRLADCPYFQVMRHDLREGGAWTSDGFFILAVAAGTVEMVGRRYGPGSFVMVPATWRGPRGVVADGAPATILEVRLP